MSVRLRNAEFLEFSKQIEGTGLKNNQAMRIAARRIGGFIEIEPIVRDTIQQISRRFDDIATSINELTQTASSSIDVKEATMEAFLNERHHLGLQLIRLEQQLQYILNVSHRRTDGRQRLDQYATAFQD
ncbi:DNA mobilization endonuclease VirD1/MobC family subunit [uncultured Roseibium sp.]